MAMAASAEPNRVDQIAEGGRADIVGADEAQPVEPLAGPVRAGRLSSTGRPRLSLSSQYGTPSRSGAG